jgi:YkoY family integral membrane protein
MIWQALLTIGFLVVLEGLLSFDNALALAAMVRHLPKEQQKKALVYGIWGAIGFRLLALTILTYLLRSMWVKFIGGGYLLWMAANHFVEEANGEDAVGRHSASFWKMVLFVELTDITFSMDSILASVAVSQKLWIVFTGGALGIFMMRFVSSLFIKLIDLFPRLEESAFLLVGAVGTKLTLEGFGVNFDELLPAGIFWSVMAAGLAFGFTERKHNEQSTNLCEQPKP